MQSQYKEIDDLLKSFNESSGKVTTTWLAFISAMAYLSIALSSVTPLKLLMGTTITLPLVGLDSQVESFFKFSPLILLMLHYYLLMQTFLLDECGRRLADEINGAPLTTIERYRYWIQLDKFVFSQQLRAYFDRGAPVRPGVVPVSIFTIYMAPALILFWVQLVFLPYHSEGITWFHRLVLVADVGMSMYCYLRIRRGLPNGRRRVGTVIALSSSVALVLAAVTVATFPEESIETRLAGIELMRGKLDGGDFAWAPTAAAVRHLGLVRNIIISNAFSDLTESASSAPIDIRRDLRNRNFRHAVITSVDLRQSDLSGSDLTGAVLDHVNLSGATFVGTRLASSEWKEASLEGAVFQRADMTAAKLHQARLRGANLEGVSGDGADFSEALMEGCVLSLSSFVGATFEGAVLYGSEFSDTTLIGANLYNAQLQSTRWDLTDFRFADLRSANLEAVDGFAPHLEAAVLDRSRVAGASFGKAYIVGSTVKNAHNVEFAYVRPQLEDVDYQEVVQIVEHSRVDQDHRKVLEARISGFRTSRQGLPVAADATWALIADNRIPSQELLEKRADIQVKWACARDGAPYVARRLVHTLRTRIAITTGFRTRAACGLLASTCEGAQKLSPIEHDALVDMVAESKCQSAKSSEAGTARRGSEGRRSNAPLGQ